MRLKALIIVLIGAMLIMQGCATFKGAKEGFKEDWQALGRVDDWMKENMW